MITEMYLSTRLANAKCRAHGLWRWQDNTEIEDVKSGLVETPRYDIEPIIDWYKLCRDNDNGLSDSFVGVTSSFMASGVNNELKFNIQNFPSTLLA